MSLEATLAELVQMLDQRLREITAELHRRPLPEPALDTVNRATADAYLFWLLEHGSIPVSVHPPQFQKPLDLSELTVRAINAIGRSGCKTAFELACFGRTRLLDLPHCGETTVNEIRALLQENHGLELAD
jgi:DNA-directed RNA polymerase alpha subunit